MLQKVMLNIVNFSKIRTLFNTGSASPVFKSNMEKNWNRIPAKNIYYYRSHPHGNRYILSFVHVFKSTLERCEFAYCIPYSYTQLQEFLNDLEAKKLPYFRRELLTLSVQKRRVDLLTIVSPSYFESEQSHKIVFLSARVHPGESPSSIVLHGFLEFLLGNSDEAKRLRSLYVFKIVPMLNPDGVYLGNYRCSYMGFDLNRQWQSPSPWAQPTISATKNLLLRYHRNLQTNSFLYGNLVSEVSKCDRQLYIPYLLAQITNDYSLQYTQFNTDIEKAGTNRRFALYYFL